MTRGSDHPAPGPPSPSIEEGQGVGGRVTSSNVVWGPPEPVQFPRHSSPGSSHPRKPPTSPGASYLGCGYREGCRLCRRTLFWTGGVTLGEGRRRVPRRSRNESGKVVSVDLKAKGSRRSTGVCDYRQGSTRDGEYGESGRVTGLRGPK